MAGQGSQAKGNSGSSGNARAQEQAVKRLARAGALHTLVRGGLPLATQKRLLKDALPKPAARQLPKEVWASLAASIAAENPLFAGTLGQALHDHLGWDQEPAELDDWWDIVVERPLQALWMAALSRNRAVRKELAHITHHCLENFRASPDSSPPSWEFVEAIVDVQAETLTRLRDVERRAAEATRKHEVERARLAELRKQLKRMRRESSELRASRTRVEPTAQNESSPAPGPEPRSELQELERRLRRVEKEREHLLRELERERERKATTSSPMATVSDSGTVQPAVNEPPAPEEEVSARLRLLGKMLGRLLRKGKVGASHTQEDNLLRGVADHEKGEAKQLVELLCREGLLVSKPTTTTRHVSLNPDHTGEIRRIVDGTIDNPRLARFLAGPITR
jgi:hypothetical protein